VAWGVAAVLAVVLLAGTLVGVRFYYGVLSLSVSRHALILSLTDECKADSALLAGIPPLPPWPGVTRYYCGHSVSVVRQVYRRGNIVGVVETQLYWFRDPWHWFL
jgi:hypothetical protein